MEHHDEEDTTDFSSSHYHSRPSSIHDDDAAGTSYSQAEAREEAANQRRDDENKRKDLARRAAAARAGEELLRRRWEDETRRGREEMRGTGEERREKRKEIDEGRGERGRSEETGEERREKRKEIDEGRKERGRSEETGKERQETRKEIKDERGERGRREETGEDRREKRKEIDEGRGERGRSEETIGAGKETGSREERKREGWGEGGRREERKETRKAKSEERNRGERGEGREIDREDAEVTAKKIRAAAKRKREAAAAVEEEHLQEAEALKAEARAEKWVEKSRDAATDAATFKAQAKTTYLYEEDDEDAEAISKKKRAAAQRKREAATAVEEEYKEKVEAFKAEVQAETWVKKSRDAATDAATFKAQAKTIYLDEEDDMKSNCENEENSMGPSFHEREGDSRGSIEIYFAGGDDSRASMAEESRGKCTGDRASSKQGPVPFKGLKEAVLMRLDSPVMRFEPVQFPTVDSSLRTSSSVARPESRTGPTAPRMDAITAPLTGGPTGALSLHTKCTAPVVGTASYLIGKRTMMKESKESKVSIFSLHSKNSSGNGAALLRSASSAFPKGSAANKVHFLPYVAQKRAPSSVEGGAAGSLASIKRVKSDSASPMNEHVPKRKELVISTKSSVEPILLSKPQSNAAKDMMLPAASSLSFAPLQGSPNVEHDETQPSMEMEDEERTKYAEKSLSFSMSQTVTAVPLAEPLAAVPLVEPLAAAKRQSPVIPSLSSIIALSYFPSWNRRSLGMAPESPPLAPDLVSMLRPPPVAPFSSSNSSVPSLELRLDEIALYEALEKQPHKGEEKFKQEFTRSWTGLNSNLRNDIDEQERHHLIKVQNEEYTRATARKNYHFNRENKHAEGVGLQRKIVLLGAELSKWQGLLNYVEKGNPNAGLEETKATVSSLLRLMTLARDAASNKTNDWLCVCCTRLPRDVALLPCKHLAVCSECYPKLLPDTNGLKPCPICRQPVTDTFKSVWA